MRDELQLTNLYLYHYFDKSLGPLRSISSLSNRDAEKLLSDFRLNGKCFAGKRDSNYLKIRYRIERYIKNKFISIGGKSSKDYPHYFTLGEASWIKTWYPNPCCLKIPLSELDSSYISFTYGDTFPAFRYKNNNPTRGKVFTIKDIISVIKKYGLPQDVNPTGELGPLRYVEAQVWCDIKYDKYLIEFD